jgi:CO/xanthine dehydrogenase FAD-binding subunit
LPSDYARPGTLEAVVELLGRDGAHVLAGGTDVVTMRTAGTLAPSCLVDIKHVDELRGVATKCASVTIGAATTCDELARPGTLPPSALIDGAALVGGWQTRTRATVGGNVCRASPAGDTLCGVLVLGGRLELVSRGGARSVAAAEFFTGPGTTVRAPDELLTRIVLPHRRGGSAYRRFTYRNAMDLAVVGVAAWLELHEGRCVDAAIAIGACGPVPRLVPSAAEALVGSAVDTETLAAACTAVVAAADPIDDVRGTRQHRLHVLAPLTRRVVADALTRAAEPREGEGR